MADYAATVTLDVPKMERMSRHLGCVVGKCDITNYNQIGAEITDITKYFNDATVDIRVINDGVSDNGYIVRWSTVDKCFHAFYPRSAQAAVTTDKLTITASGAANITDGQSVTVDAAFRSAVDAAAGTECADDVDVGEVNFIAIGLI